MFIRLTAEDHDEHRRCPGAETAGQARAGQGPDETTRHGGIWTGGRIECSLSLRIRAGGQRSEGSFNP
jgi:hypothetical protein